MCKASNYLKMTYKCLYLSTALLFALSINDHRCKEQCNTISAVAWQTIHEDIVVDAFRCKNSSSALLFYKQQASQKRCFLNRHSTACG